MTNLRKYRLGPFPVAVLHGGPGALGEMAPVARELSSIIGVLEPLQTATTLELQVHELKAVLEKHAALPLTLIGFSWGAMLSFIFAARYPSFVRKLILISSAPYDEKYAAKVALIRLGRLTEQEHEQALSLMQILNYSSVSDKNTTFARWGKLLSRKSHSTSSEGDRFICERVVEPSKAGLPSRRITMRMPVVFGSSP